MDFAQQKLLRPKSVSKILWLTSQRYLRPVQPGPTATWGNPQHGRQGLCNEGLAFINDHNIDWAWTGRAVAVLKAPNTPTSASFRVCRHCRHLADTPASKRYGAIQDVLNRELQAIWLTGKSVDDALADAESEVQDLLDR